MKTVCKRSLAAFTLLVVVAWVLGSRPALAHGIAGKRFFPATLATDDPFVADELSLPTIESRKMPAAGEEPVTRETGFSVDVSKRLTDNLGVGLGATYNLLQPDGGDAQRGFDNLAASIKYKFYQSDEHETILSTGVDWDVGGSGSKRVGAESFSTVTPGLFFGKGFGDLPESMQFARPLAVTGVVGLAVPTRAGTTSVGDDGQRSVERHPHMLQWGVAVEYSVPYLQSFVRDIGLREPFNRLIPVVEFAMTTALDRGASGTTGTINPGVIWAGRYAQIAVEAIVPVNGRSGNRVGWIAQLHFFLDDLFPTTIGRPIFGR